MISNNDLFNTFSPIYNYDISATDETGILLETSTQNEKYDCFMKCNSLKTCMMISYKSVTCKLYSKVKYTLSLTPISIPCLFEKVLPDYSSINNYMTNYWPMNNHVMDIVGGSDMFGGPISGKSFVNDRLNRPNGALYLQNSYYLLPEGVYFSGEYTLSLWVKMISMTTYGRIMSLLSASIDFHGIIFTLSTTTSSTPYVYTSLNSISSHSISAKSLSIGKWQNVVFTLDSNSTSTIYIDGVIVNQQANYLTPLNFIRNFTYFGASYNNCLSNAIFDDVKIFNRSLRQEEVKTLLNMFY